MRAATTLVLLIAGTSVLSSVQGLDYFTGTPVTCHPKSFVAFYSRDEY